MMQLFAEMAAAAAARARRPRAFRDAPPPQRRVPKFFAAAPEAPAGARARLHLRALYARFLAPAEAAALPGARRSGGPPPPPPPPPLVLSGHAASLTPY